MTTLQQLYEEYDAKTASYRIIVGGADITERVASFGWSFSIGSVPTASLIIPSLLMVDAIQEEAEVEIWFGFRIGMTDKRELVFGGAVVDSVSYANGEFSIDCIQDGARRLNYPFYKQIDYEFDNVLANDAVTDLLELAGVPSFVVDLDTWVIGTAIPQTLKFSNYGDAINKVATVDGTPWWALPSGTIRVERRDPLPYDTPKRTYFSGHLAAIVYTQPEDVGNPDARPRIANLSKRYNRADVNNFIVVDGGTLVTLGPNGEQNSDQIHEEIFAAPGDFDNGAPWITTPPLFQEFNYSNELIDTNAKANSVANRYLLLKNRLMQSVNVQIPLDPELFLCMTIRIIDEDSETDDLYFLESYRCSVSANAVTSDLSLIGGPYAGTQGEATPFADFRWTYEALWNRIGGNNEIGSTGCGGSASETNLGYQANMGSKLCQDIPEAVGDEDKGGNRPNAQTGQVFIGLDGSMSEDFDGQIVSWAWSDSEGHTGSGPRITFIYDPEAVSSVQVTLEVTDNDGHTDSITKTVYTRADAPIDPLPDDPTLNDTLEGGGEAAGDCTEGGSPNAQPGDPGGENGEALMYFLAGECKMMASKDNQNWNSLDKSDFGVGNFVAVDATTLTGEDCHTIALYATDEGEIVKTEDGCETGEVVFRSPRPEGITDIAFDGGECGGAYAITSQGAILKSTDGGDTWRTHKPADGIPINKLLFKDKDQYALGGDTGNPNSLIRVAKAGGSFSNLPISGPLRTAIDAAGPGFTIRTASINDEAMLIGFDGGVVPPAWMNPNPKVNSGNWTPATGLTGNGLTASAPGGPGEFAVSTEDGVFNTDDSENFTAGCPTPQNDLYWEGLPGVYMGATDEAMTKIVDDTCGPMFPNPEFPEQDEMPGCVVVRQIKVLVGCRGPEGGFWPAPQVPWSFRFGGNGSGGGGTVPPIFAAMQKGEYWLFTVDNAVDPTTGFIATSQDLEFEIFETVDRGGSSVDRWHALWGALCTGDDPQITLVSPADPNYFVRGIMAYPVNILNPVDQQTDRVDTTSVSTLTLGLTPNPTGVVIALTTTVNVDGQPANLVGPVVPLLDPNLLCYEIHSENPGDGGTIGWQNSTIPPPGNPITPTISGGVALNHAPPGGNP